MSAGSLSLMRDHGAGGVCSPASALAAILPNPQAEEHIEGRFLRADRSMLVRHYRTVSALLADLPRQRPIAHCFYGVALRRGGGTAAHCTRLGALWADIDAKLWPEELDPLAAAQAALATAPLPPSIVVGSGGGWQPYWLLAGPVEVQAERARIERLNRALAWSVCGHGRRPDPVQDVARVLRLPGSLNHKYAPERPVMVARYAPSRRFSLEEIELVLAQATPWALHDAVAHREELPIWQQSTSASCACRSAWADGLSPGVMRLLERTGACGYRSPSEADAAAATALVGAGLTADEALALLLASPRGRDAHVRKGARHQLAYWQRTVEHAARYVGPVVRHQGIWTRVGASWQHAQQRGV